MPRMLKRLLVALTTGIILAVTDVWFTATTIPEAWDVNSPVFWYIFLNRVAIGFFVAIAGIVTIHPVFGFKMFPIRGAFVGVWISLSMIGLAFLGTAETSAIVTTAVLSGAVYGIIIDILATKLAGQGRQLLHPNNE